MISERSNICSPPWFGDKYDLNEVEISYQLPDELQMFDLAEVVRELFPQFDYDGITIW